MRNPHLNKLFIDSLLEMYSSEKQIVEELPTLIQLASTSDLKEALAHHLKETEDQITRIDHILHLLKLNHSHVTCEGMAGILLEGNKLLSNKAKSPSLDAALVSAARKVEHYEIAGYGSLVSFATNLGLDSEIIDLLKKSLNEEEAADKKLTKIAEGTFFTTGVNQEAAESAMPIR